MKSPKYTVDMNSFGLSYEDAKDKNGYLISGQEMCLLYVSVVFRFPKRHMKRIRRFVSFVCKK